MSTDALAVAEPLTPAQARVARETRASAEDRASDAYERWHTLMDARVIGRPRGGALAEAAADEVAALREYALAVARVEGCAQVADALECGVWREHPASVPPGSLLDYAGELEGWRERDLPDEPAPSLPAALPAGPAAAPAPGR